MSPIPPFARRGRQCLAVLFTIAAGRVVWTAADYFLSGRSGRHRVEAAWMIAGVVALALSAWPGRPHASRSPAASVPAVTALVACLAMSLALYWPALGFGLFSDDYVLLARSSGAAWDLTRWEFVRPVPLGVMQALHGAGGAPLLHVLNVVLHGVNGWLVYRLAIRTGRRAEAAGGAAALFLAFPAAVEPVTWSSGLFDVSMVTFGLGYLLCSGSAVRWAQPAAVILLILAMLSKETAVALPVLALLSRRRLGIGAVVIGVSLALAGAYTLFRVTDAQALATVLPQGPWRYALKEIVVRPFASLAVPWTSAELTQHPVALGVAPAALLVVALGWRAVAGRSVVDLVRAAVWVLVAVLPLFGFFFVADDLQGSRYLYLPLVGWCLFLTDLTFGEGHANADRVRQLQAIALGVVAIVGAWGVQRHLEPWRDAAVLRDRILLAADAAVAASGCRSATFDGLPSAHDGAHLFRNGFAEALAPRGVVVSGSAPADCRFSWNGGEFDRAR